MVTQTLTTHVDNRKITLIIFSFHLMWGRNAELQPQTQWGLMQHRVRLLKPRVFQYAMLVICIPDSLSFLQSVNTIHILDVCLCYINLYHTNCMVTCTLAKQIWWSQICFGCVVALWVISFSSLFKSQHDWYTWLDRNQCVNTSAGFFYWSRLEENLLSFEN